MRTAVILFNGGAVQAVLDGGHGPVYTGTLLTHVPDQAALRYWSDYEEAVNSMMLSRVDELERSMSEYGFYVQVGTRRYRGEDVDLQVFPSTLRLSFSTADDFGGAPGPSRGRNAVGPGTS